MGYAAQEAVVPSSALPDTLKTSWQASRRIDGYIPSILLDSLIVESSLQ